VGTSFTRITTQNGFIDADDHEFITLQGDADVTVSAVNDVITVSTTLDLNQILRVLDFGPINSVYSSTVQLNTATSNIDFGTYTNPGTINVDLGLLDS
jgi:hypothetical protein